MLENKINKKDFWLSDEHYKKDVSKKTKICLVGTSLNGMDHIKRLEYSKNLINKQAPHYSVTRDGEIFQHYDTDYYSEFLDRKLLDKHTIIIALSNLGPLTYDSELGKLVNIFNIEVSNEEIHECDYRDYSYWHKFTKEQCESAVSLCSYICDEKGVEKKFAGHIFGLDDIYNYNGVITRPNISNKFVDINPSFNLKLFYKNNLFDK